MPGCFKAVAAWGLRPGACDAGIGRRHPASIVLRSTDIAVGTVHFVGTVELGCIQASKRCVGCAAAARKLREGLSALRKRCSFVHRERDTAVVGVQDIKLAGAFIDGNQNEIVMVDVDAFGRHVKEKTFLAFS